MISDDMKAEIEISGRWCRERYTIQNINMYFVITASLSHRALQYERARPMSKTCIQDCKQHS